MNTPLRVVKFGGSLLDCPDLASRFDRWLSEQTVATNIVVVGGGHFADAVRQYDAQQQLPCELAHRLAVSAMSLSAQLAGHLLGCPILYGIESLLERPAGTVIFDVARFMQRDEPRASGPGLPAGWHVTSDSISARLAQILEASELVLLKSTWQPELRTLEQLAAAELVDEHFPRVGCRLSAVRLVDLRGDNFPEQLIPTSAAVDSC